MFHFVLMIRIIKRIQVNFLMMAAFAVVAHMIIPHDHHILESLDGCEDHSPSSEHRTGHLPLLPVHCCSFNDLTAEKTTTFTVLKTGSNDYYERSGYHNNTCLISKFSCKLQPGEQNSFPEQVLIGLYLLRAPPLV